ncbi:hypothetical protein CRI94_02725 [Longibacter salinarum]|uniref:Uncharacterized protein n=1 Tax=Longibacter salinarum TaxID=1850348 RepID=A0A2A8D2M1_9BACT|nr:hypothetical protein [Longibacter salinarum]PEN15212.1 hypothetical protein CRI94_02725 [Longibacter salinarum]
MKRLLTTLASILGLWILVSFTGVLADGARPEFWTTSLMWSLLAGLVIAPFYAFVNSQMFATPPAPRPASDERNGESIPEENEVPSFDTGSRDAPPTRALDVEQINRMANGRKLWPEENEQETVSA